VPDRICVACSRPPDAGMKLCMTCGDKMAKHLYGVGAMLAQLDITRAGEDALTESLGRGGEQGLPFDQNAASAYANLTSVVDFWAMHLAGTRNALNEVPTPGAWTALWLARRLDWLRALDAAQHAYTDLDAAMVRAQHAIDLPLPRPRRIGLCPETRDDGQWCPGEVWAYTPIRDDDPWVLRCRDPECDHHRKPWTTDQWHQLDKRMDRRIQQRERAVKRPDGEHRGRSPADRGLGAHDPPLGAVRPPEGR
jgi:hypothetical protein